jgi:hypothetical protein
MPSKNNLADLNNLKQPQVKLNEGDGVQVDFNNPDYISHHYFSPVTSQSQVIGYSRSERDKLFPGDLSQARDLNRNIEILSHPENVRVHQPMSVVLGNFID